MTLTWKFPKIRGALRVPLKGYYKGTIRVPLKGAVSSLSSPRGYCGFGIGA